jgi:hypothetical protein
MDAVSHVGIFDPALRTVAPLTFSLVQPPPLSVSKYSIYEHCVAGRGRGVLSPGGDYTYSAGV